MKDLKAFELREVEGGYIAPGPWIIGAFLGSMLYEAVSNPEACWQAMKEGWNDASN